VSNGEGSDQRVAAPIPDNYVRQQLVLLTTITFICHHYKLLALASCNPQFTLVLVRDAIRPTGRGLYLWSRMEKCYILSWFGGLQLSSVKIYMEYFSDSIKLL
jgi:hypothetical protein